MKAFNTEKGDVGMDSFNDWSEIEFSLHIYYSSGNRTAEDTLQYLVLFLKLTEGRGKTVHD